VLPFVLPSFVLVLGVAVAYVQFKGLGAIQALFYGIAPAVMAVLALAAIKLARLTNERDARLWAITLVIGVVTAATGTEIALLVVAAGLIMMIWEAPPRRGRRIGATTGSGPAMLAAAPAVSHGLLTGILTAGGLGTLGLFFLKAGAFIFGSGLAIVPFLRSGVVEQHHWLTDAAFLDAVAIGLITPGPVVITATFIGYLVGGFVGAGVATVAIFIPIYIGVVVPGRWFVRHKSHPRVRGFVKGATAAAAGAIAGATVVLSKGAIADWPTVVIALAAVVFLLRFKNREPVLVLLAAAAGLALHPLAG
jgi:chromate transporter